MRGAGIGTNSKIFPDKQFGNYRELYILFKAALKRELSMKKNTNFFWLSILLFSFSLLISDTSLAKDYKL